jgi:hypothetical protein
LKAYVLRLHYRIFWRAFKDMVLPPRWKEITCLFAPIVIYLRKTKRRIISIMNHERSAYPLTSMFDIAMHIRTLLTNGITDAYQAIGA